MKATECLEEVWPNFFSHGLKTLHDVANCGGYVSDKNTYEQMKNFVCDHCKVDKADIAEMKALKALWTKATKLTAKPTNKSKAKLMIEQSTLDDCELPSVVSVERLLNSPKAFESPLRQYYTRDEEIEDEKSKLKVTDPADRPAANQRFTVFSKAVLFAFPQVIKEKLKPHRDQFSLALSSKSTAIREVLTAEVEVRKHLFTEAKKLIEQQKERDPDYVEKGDSFVKVITDAYGVFGNAHNIWRSHLFYVQPQTPSTETPRSTDRWGKDGWDSGKKGTRRSYQMDDRWSGRRDSEWNDGRYGRGGGYDGYSKTGRGGDYVQPERRRSRSTRPGNRNFDELHWNKNGKKACKSLMLTSKCEKFDNGNNLFNIKPPIGE